MIPSWPPGSLASLAPDLTLVAFLVAAEALVLFCTSSAAALELYSRSRVLELAREKGVEAKVEACLERTGAYELSARIGRFLGTGMLVVGIAYFLLQGHLVEAPTSAEFPWGSVAATLAIAFGINFLVNEVLVRLLATRRPDAALLSILPWLEGLRIFTIPVRVPLAWIAKRVFRVQLEDPAQSARQEVLESVEEGEREGSLTPDEAEMIESIMDLDGVVVDDVCTPRGELAMVQDSARLDEAARFMIERGHRRAPVYGKDRDDVVGVVYAFDILAQVVRGRAGRIVQEVMRSPFFVPEGKPLNDLLSEMRGRRVSLAVVLNEFGGTSGVITMEDVLEEIVGEIEDEHDRETRSPVTVRNGTLIVDARTPIEEVNEALSIDLPEVEDFETIGGLVFHKLGKVPGKGDEVLVDGVRLTVTEADERTARRLRVQIPTSEDT